MQLPLHVRLDVVVALGRSLFVRATAGRMRLDLVGLLVVVRELLGLVFRHFRSLLVGSPVRVPSALTPTRRGSALESSQQIFQFATKAAILGNRGDSRGCGA